MIKGVTKKIFAAFGKAISNVTKQKDVVAVYCFACELTDDENEIVVSMRSCVNPSFKYHCHNALQEYLR
jgi:hypothetical protein